MPQGEAISVSLASLAEAPAVQEAMQLINRHRRWVTERHLALCRIPAPTFQEQERASWMATELKQLGWDAKVDRAGNVVAQRSAVKSLRDVPLIALTAHLDTVLAPREPGEVTLARDGRLLGPGVSDNGVGLAGLLAVARVISESPVFESLPVPLVLLANVGEEGEGNLSGMRFFCRPSCYGSKVGAFVVLDGPSTEHITTRALASRRYEVTVSGPGGHSWSDFGVGNPIHTLCRAVSLFCDRAPELLSESKSSYNFGIIEGGSTVNAIATGAGAKVDLRSESPAQIDEMVTLLTGSLELALEWENGAARSNGARRVAAKVREIGSRPGGQLSDDSPLLAHLKAVDAHLGIRSQLDCASTDANVPLSMGLPAISIGAGGSGGGAHTPGEWYHPEGREKGLSRVMLLLSMLMADAHPIMAHALSGNV